MAAEKRPPSPGPRSRPTPTRPCASASRTKSFGDLWMGARLDIFTGTVLYNRRRGVHFPALSSDRRMSWAILLYWSNFFLVSGSQDPPCVTRWPRWRYIGTKWATNVPNAQTLTPTVARPCQSTIYVKDVLLDLRPYKYHTSTDLTRHLCLSHRPDILIAPSAIAGQTFLVSGLGRLAARDPPPPCVTRWWRWRHNAPITGNEAVTP